MARKYKGPVIDKTVITCVIVLTEVAVGRGTGRYSEKGGGCEVWGGLLV